MDFVNAKEHSNPQGQNLDGLRRDVLGLFPVLVVFIYPILLRVFHWDVGEPGSIVSGWRLVFGAVLVVAMFSPLVVAVVFASRSFAGDRPTIREIRLRRLAYASAVAPSLYVVLGVVQTLLGSQVPDDIIWYVVWMLAGLWAWSGSTSNYYTIKGVSGLAKWRIGHGIAGALILVFVGFHLANHLFFLEGAQAHSAVMALGRHFYRAPLVEPVLVGLMVFQVLTGLWLAWRWSVEVSSWHRVVQTISGLYLSIFILGHMNSVFIYARLFLKEETGWAFATGAPTGLIHDAWNIRLLPHYALGVFLVLLHLCSGLRVVMMAHGGSGRIANLVWTVGAIVSALIAGAIMCGMCGLRIQG